MRLVDRILSLRGVGTMQCATPVRVHSAGEWSFPIVRVLRASYLELTLPPFQQKNDGRGTVVERSQPVDRRPELQWRVPRRGDALSRLLLRVVRGEEV